MTSARFCKAVIVAFGAVVASMKVPPAKILALVNKAENDGLDNERESFRAKLFAEVAEKLRGVDGGEWNPDKIAQKVSALKGNPKFALPPIPPGKKGKRIDENEAAAQRGEAEAQYAALGLKPIRDENGKVTGWEAAE